METTLLQLLDELKTPATGLFQDLGTMLFQVSKGVNVGHGDFAVFATIGRRSLEALRSSTIDTEEC